MKLYKCSYICFSECKLLQQHVFAGSNADLSHDILRHIDSGATNSDHSSTDSLHTARSHSQDPTEPTRTSASASETAPMILELVLGDKPVAVAVRQKHVTSSGRDTATTNTTTQASDTFSKSSRGSQARAQNGNHSHQTASSSKHPATGSNLSSTCFYSMDGAVLAAEQEGNIYKGGFPGTHTHTLLKGQTPLVRHMHIVTSATGTTLQSRTIVCDTSSCFETMLHCTAQCMTCFKLPLD